MAWWILMVACGSGGGDTAAVPEPLDLPADPSATGVPVGVTTVQHGGVTLEVWYPASDSAAGAATEVADIDQFVPASVTEVLGALPLPSLDTGAVRDAPVRVPVAPYPVLFFSTARPGSACSPST